MRTAYFHEDSYCQVELLPRAAEDYCTAEMNKIAEFSAAHRDGDGFTDIYLRGEAPATIRALAISMADWRTDVDPLLPSFDTIYTGYSSEQTVCKSTFGWGLSAGQVMFAELRDGRYVGAVWFGLLGRMPKEHIAAWILMLRSIPRAADFIIADWNALRIIDPSDVVELAAYLGDEGGE